MTCSIVARDPVTGRLGVAVQTAVFGVGSIVPWARAGVGAVATQAISEPAYGHRCLDSMSSGLPAPAALDAAVAADDAALLRQVGVVGADGSVAAFTGEWCIDHAGHVLGDQFSVQANMMASPEVWPAMVTAFTASTGTLARRLLQSLIAGQAAGGDARGVMSAALLVVAAERTDPWAGKRVDLRVERSDDPLGEVARLLDSAEAFAQYSSATEQLTSGDPGGALESLDRALTTLPEEENFRFLRAGALLVSGEIEPGTDELRALIATRPSWEVIARSFAVKGLVPVPQGLTIDDVLG